MSLKGDWIVGTGGANLRKSSGHGTIIYAMRVDEKLPLGGFYDDPRFEDRSDAKHDLPRRGHFALVSRHFFYFGRNAIDIPTRFQTYPLEKTGRGFLRDFAEDFIEDFTNWLETTYKTGMNGWPCDPLPGLGEPKCTYKVKRKRTATP